SREETRDDDGTRELRYKNPFDGSEITIRSPRSEDFERVSTEVLLLELLETIGLLLSREELEELIKLLQEEYPEWTPDQALQWLRDTTEKTIKEAAEQGWNKEQAFELLLSSVPEKIAEYLKKLKEERETDEERRKQTEEDREEWEEELRERGYTISRGGSGGSHHHHHH
uniref:N5 n=1 Tax=synthetic construct TaxID=32630 RepID=UPI003CE5C966